MNIVQLSNLSGSNANSSWSFVPAPSAVIDNENPQFSRICVLSQTGLVISVAGNSIGFPLEELLKLAAKTNPNLTWAPNFSNGQPANAYIGAGNHNACSFTAVAQDEIGGDIAYQWLFGSNGANVSNGGIYSNATTNTLNISNTATVIGQTYICLATNPSGSNQSNSAGVYFDPSISVQPSNQTVTHPVSAYFSVVASGQSALSFQWQSNGSNITTGGTANYAGYTTNTLNVGNSTGLSTTLYRVIISDTAGSVTSNNGTLTVL